ncbi:MAG TPA: tetratricopeptide repeat protein, partial [Chroococcales cyanobacterium]
MKCDTIPAMEKFLQIQEQALGATAPEVAATVSKLGDLYFNMSRFDKAEALYRRALEIRQCIVGVHSDEVEESRTNLAKVEEARKNANKHFIDPTETSDSIPAISTVSVAPQPMAKKPAGTTDSGVKFEALVPEKQAADRQEMHQRVKQTKVISDAISDLEAELELLRQMVG